MTYLIIALALSICATAFVTAFFAAAKRGDALVDESGFNHGGGYGR
jgi:hypothetical protein